MLLVTVVAISGILYSNNVTLGETGVTTSYLILLVAGFNAIYYYIWSFYSEILFYMYNTVTIVFEFSNPTVLLL